MDPRTDFTKIIYKGFPLTSDFVDSSTLFVFWTNFNTSHFIEIDLTQNVACILKYSGNLNSKIVGYSHGPKWFAP